MELRQKRVPEIVFCDASGVEHNDSGQDPDAERSERYHAQLDPELYGKVRLHFECGVHRTHQAGVKPVLRELIASQKQGAGPVPSEVTPDVVPQAG